MFKVLLIYNNLVIYFFSSSTQKPLEAGEGQTLAALLEGQIGIHISDLHCRP